jgi:3-deoxy-manno-octulosonate cytidylyltransferase (CMP-KDO synthetase)
MKTAIVIPARLASTRFPEKMLKNETGWPLIRHVYEQAKQSKLAQRVLIATDDERIADVIREFGGDVVMTDPNHPTGTDRLAEVAATHLSDVDLIVNVQGDEPELEPEKIDALIDLYYAAGDAGMATLVCPFSADKFEGTGSPRDPNCCKAVLGKPVIKKDSQTTTVIGYEALYFSRSIMPYPRESEGKVTDPTSHYLHIGIYAYAPSFLKKFVTLPQGKLEKVEKLEQLRALENGYKIVAGIVDRATPGIDTREDYDAFLTRWKAKGN